MAQFSVGDIASVNGDLQTITATRPLPDNSGEVGVVENEDQAHAMIRFQNGAIGTIETSRVACGRKMGLSYEVTSTKGSILFDQERLAEIKLYTRDGNSTREGIKTVLVDHENPDYKNFCMSADDGLGHKDQKIVEVRDLI